MRKLFYLFQVITISIASAATAQATTHNIHIEWTYDSSQAPDLVGFKLYQEEISVCHIADPAGLAMDCMFDSPVGTFNFYLAAYTDTKSSPLSAPFPFTLTEPDTPADPRIPVKASQLSLNDTLTLQLSPGILSDGIIDHTWSFSDGTPDVSNQGEAIAHTFPANKVSRYTLTVTYVSGETYTTTGTTIRFLKKIHAIVIYHINSFLLKKDPPVTNQTTY